MDHVIETSVVAEQESTLNKNIGDLIVAELVSRSPNTIEKKRKQILRLLADWELALGGIVLFMFLESHILCQVLRKQIDASLS